MKQLFSLTIILILTACSSPDTFTAKVEDAHKATIFKANEAVSFNLQLFFNGKQRMNGVVYTLSNMAKTRIEKNDGITLVYNSKEAYVSPADSAYSRARFDALTWPYFFVAPYKYTDPGCVIEDRGKQQLNGVNYDVAKMTFESGTGDSPDDWYIIYADTATHLVYAMAYIVTSSKKTREEAEKNPHAIVYKNYKDVNGVPFATEWEFWEWREGQGLTKQIGEGTITDIQFLKADQIGFTKPEGSKAVPAI